MAAMNSGTGTINIRASTRKVDVDNRIPLSFYYRIAMNLLKQASIYREERSLIDLYVILLRFSSLMSETVPFHRDYQILLPKQRATFKKKLIEAINELETLKPEVHRQVNELNSNQMVQPGISGVSYSLAFSNESTPYSQSKHVQGGREFQKWLLNLPLPKEETLNRHSVLGPNGLWSQWQGPGLGVKVNYPCNLDGAITAAMTSENHGERCNDKTLDATGTRQEKSAMDLVLSLDDGRWSNPSMDPPSLFTDALVSREPLPPPVLAEVQPLVVPIQPSEVADPRPGPPQLAIHDAKPYQQLHIQPKMMEAFLKLAEINTGKNLETCGILAGSLKNRKFNINTLIIPKQESTSDSCQTTNEEEIFEVQDKLSLFPLGWIHTHPTQTCFMSSIDLHTHYSYQVMLPEAIAIVMAPTDTARTHGIFHLSDPGGISVIRNCEQRGFHPHEEPVDGNPIYEHCSHVYMNPGLKFEIVDLR